VCIGHYNKAETALAEARKNTYCADLLLCCLFPILISHIFQSFSVHVISLNTTYLVVKWVLSRLSLKCTKIDFDWSSAPDPAGGAYDTPLDPLVGWEGALPISLPLDALGVLVSSLGSGSG